MKCKCGNEIKVAMGANLKCEGCRVLTSFTTVITAECEKCGAKFQVPISSENVVVVKKEE